MCNDPSFMRFLKSYLLSFLPILLIPFAGFFVFHDPYKNNPYYHLYETRLTDFINSQSQMIDYLSLEDLNSSSGKQRIKEQLHQNRMLLKSVDFWLRYLHPNLYRKVNGPLAVEWETEVFEKFEAPYKRIGTGFSLAENYLDEPNPQKDSLSKLLLSSKLSSELFLQDSVRFPFKSPDHFYFANRLFLLNLAAIYTTGFECPDPSAIIPELRFMLKSMTELYAFFNLAYPSHPISESYRLQFAALLEFVGSQTNRFESFDHYTFIRNHINPLFKLNQEAIQTYKCRTTSFNDYSLNNKVHSIFDKNLYEGQDYKGIYRNVKNDSVLQAIHELGRLLFYDPLLSGNLKRACVSCHKPKENFTDTTQASSFKFDHINKLSRNTPSLFNVVHNHLIMLDGKHINLQNQLKDVISNPDELNTSEAAILSKVLSCKEYKSKFQTLKQYGSSTDIQFEHISSAIIFYYSKFSFYHAPFDQAMDQQAELKTDEKEGFNLFMGKAQCGTCHFIPQFNGVKPPYIGSEFEVLGVPTDTNFTALSSDSGRAKINPAFETLHAFRTGSLRNSTRTKPYMHQGVFNSLDELIEFYNKGGGLGRGLKVENQTLSSDHLNLTTEEKAKLIAFLHSLDEDIPIEDPPISLPLSNRKEFNKRKVGGEY